MISYLFMILISLAAVKGQYKFENCGTASDVIQLTHLEINPHPMKIPSSVIFSLHVDASADVISPIKTEFKLSKATWIGNIQVPCTDGVGSCTYDDWCVFCKTCSCPILAGKQIMNMPMEVSTSVPTGEYSVEIRLTSKTGQKGCVKITKIKVEK
ncbi:unnamed protein product [Rotaria sp. Silwood2]|nr:unnamed protein product [Rotaria sp. Silwood2]CAF3402011.1 unnamed protein product [Rotaria sp. Silwood2]CAF3515209.1 unnamed protein product [Rotaria sp. Silwood2]CAF4582093.1 unnamed protein product [Rotaria sp. Silwood2]CAF4768019.1 unnamed protein product [Rotaria sp. Silwood2]